MPEIYGEIPSEREQGAVPLLAGTQAIRNARLRLRSQYFNPGGVATTDFNFSSFGNPDYVYMNVYSNVFAGSQFYILTNDGATLVMQVPKVSSGSVSEIITDIEIPRVGTFFRVSISGDVNGWYCTIKWYEAF